MIGNASFESVFLSAVEPPGFLRYVWSTAKYNIYILKFKEKYFVHFLQHPYYLLLNILYS